MLNADDHEAPIAIAVADEVKATLFKNEPVSDVFVMSVTNLLDVIPTEL